MLHRTENRETLIRVASELAAFARSGEWKMLHYRRIRTIFVQRRLRTKEISIFEISSEVITDHAKIGAVTTIEEFESAGTFVIEEQVPSEQSGSSKSWVRKSRGFEQHVRPLILTEIGTKILEPHHHRSQ